LFILSFIEPQSFVTWRQIEIDSSRINNFNQVSSFPYFSKRWAMERFLGLTQEEINKNHQMLIEENPEKFEAIIDMKKKIEDIIESNNFGVDIQILSDFIEAPAMFINYYMKRAKITEYSVFDVEYEPKFKIAACEKTTFDFKININNSYDVEVSIHKIDRDEEDEESVDRYKLQFRFMDEIETVESDTIKNIHFLIGSEIAKLLDRKLKNK
jgi:hypothetical protein